MLDIFVGGLWEDIKHVVCIQRPSFLSEAIRLAREIEAYNFASRGKLQPTGIASYLMISQLLTITNLLQYFNNHAFLILTGQRETTHNSL